VNTRREKVYVVGSGRPSPGAMHYAGILRDPARSALLDDEGHFVPWSGELWTIRDKLPSDVRFWSCLAVLDETDYPLTDMGWDIASRRFVEVLSSIQSPEYQTVPVTFDQHPEWTAPSTELSNKRGLLAYRGVPAASNNDYFGLIPPAIECLDIPNSRGVQPAHNPFTGKALGYFTSIDEVAIRTPPGGFPAVFRIQDNPGQQLLLNEAARAAVEAAHLRVTLFPNEVKVSG
jgi:hypothetical protein